MRMTPPPAVAAPPKPATNPYLGILGVFVGAGIATLNARLLGIGLPDLRGALGLGFDEASWLPTALNMATMFSGVFVVFLSASLGPRRILLPAAAIFLLASASLPFAPGYRSMLAADRRRRYGVGHVLFPHDDLRVDLSSEAPHHLRHRRLRGRDRFRKQHCVRSAGLVRGSAVVAMDILDGRRGYALMMLCIYFGIPRKPVTSLTASWRGFAYFSVGISLVYGALDQGERLDWLNSGVIVAMLAGGVFLLVVTGVRRILQPNPILNPAFLHGRNIVILALSVFVFKFVHLATIVLIRDSWGTFSNIVRSRSARPWPGSRCLCLRWYGW
ncbi:MAG: hypothetical protein WDO73_30940 [Ignavibacteriota bacterium]